MNLLLRCAIATALSIPLDLSAEGEDKIGFYLKVSASQETNHISEFLKRIEGTSARIAFEDQKKGDYAYLGIHPASAADARLESIRLKLTDKILFGAPGQPTEISSRELSQRLQRISEDAAGAPSKSTAVIVDLRNSTNGELLWNTLESCALAGWEFVYIRADAKPKGARSDTWEPRLVLTIPRDKHARSLFRFLQAVSGTGVQVGYIVKDPNPRHVAFRTQILQDEEHVDHSMQLKVTSAIYDLNAVKKTPQTIKEFERKLRVHKGWLVPDGAKATITIHEAENTDPVLLYQLLGTCAVHGYDLIYLKPLPRNQAKPRRIPTIPVPPAGRPSKSP